MIARPRCPDRKRTAPCRPTNRKKSTRSRVEKGAPFRVKGGAALPVQKGARFRGVYQLRQGRFREGAGNRRSAGGARLQMLDRAARCAPGPLLRRLDHQGHRAGAVLHSCAVEREQQLGFRLARDRARREQEQAHFHGARGGRAGPAPALELFVSSTQWIDAFEGRLAPQIDQLAQRLPTMTTSRPRKMAASDAKRELAVLDARLRARKSWFGAPLARSSADAGFTLALALCVRSDGDRGS